ncbi:MAG: DUF72 domain-containing protein [Chloroflexi bacterium]|nr:MAG: DUF72 domain-containing protein [Chloroflexota bacterium]
MARFWIGTSGWNYNHWKERFYPKGTPQRDWLPYYAQHFPTVEINYSFYRQPSDNSWDAWRDAVPAGFRFAVKAHRYLTHRIRLKDPEHTLQLVFQGARRLGDRCGPILYQLPPYFKRTGENEARLQRLLEMLPARFQHAVEFRDSSWFGEETINQLRRHGVAFCAFDRVKLEPPLVATAGFAYVRFHGSPPRYQGNYTDAMLRDWANRLNALSNDLDDAYIYFNNDWQAFAVANAMKLAKLLGAKLPEPALA